MRVISSFISMTKRSRYTLIGVGILSFFIIAPTLLWYVQGKPLRSDPTGPDRTGIIAVETDPRDAEIWVNGEKRTTTPGAVRFLETGRYAVEVRKEGYRTWQKTVSVIGGRVTHANPNPAALKLIRDSLPEVLATHATAIAIRGNQTAYTTATPSLVLIEEDQNVRTLSLPAPATMLIFLPSIDRYLVGGTGYAWIVDPATWTHRAASPSLSTAKVQGGGSSLFALTPAQELVQIPFANLTQTKSIATRVRSFATHGSELYYLSQDPDGRTLLHHSTIEDNALVQAQALPTDLSGDPATVFVDEQKAVYVLQAQTLYRFAEHATEIARGVTAASVETGALAYTTPGELWWYDSRSLRAHLVSRTSTPIQTYAVSPAQQYGIYTDAEGLAASELNTEAGQNRYILDPESTTITRIIFRDQEHLLYLTGNTLKQLRLF